MTIQNASEATSETQTRKKLSITISPDVARRAKMASANFSLFVEQALEEKLIGDAMVEYARLRGRDPIDDVLQDTESDVEAAA